MSKIYLFQSGSSLINEAIECSIYRKDIVNIDGSYKSKLLRGFRWLHLKSNLDSKKWWVKFKVKNISIQNINSNTIILFDSPVWINNINYIKEKYDKINIVFWYWNIVKDPEKVYSLKKYCDAVFIFDKNEAFKYNIKYHPQFYWRYNPNKKKIKYDIVFIGRNKGRLKTLESIFLELKQNDLNPFFYVVKDTQKDFSSIIDLQNNNLQYDKVLDLIYESKAILEVNKEFQDGLTLRALESLFFEKKLITNNKDLINYDFYCAENIVIFKDNVGINSNFIDNKFIPINDDIKQTYTFDHWLKTLSKYN